MTDSIERPRVPSIRDVARLADVSHQTVSRVLNDHPSIRFETKQRVLQAIETLDYRPNQAARALVTSKLNLIGVLAATVGEHGPTSSLVAIENAARAAGFSMTTLNLPSTSAEDIGAAVRQLLREQIDGMIVLAPQLRVFNILRAMSITVPYVSLQTGPDGADEKLVVEQVDGARSAVEHLIGLGHTEIMHLAGPKGWIEADSRMHGYLRALNDADLPVHPPIRGDWTADFGHYVGREISHRPAVTAVFAANDLMAIGLMHGLREGGRSVPAGVSVVGFDDIPVAAHVWPPLTTVRIEYQELGSRAFALLAGAMRGEEYVADPPSALELVVRASTAKAVSESR